MFLQVPYRIPTTSSRRLEELVLESRHVASLTSPLFSDHLVTSGSFFFSYLLGLWLAKICMQYEISLWCEVAVACPCFSSLLAAAQLRGGPSLGRETVYKYFLWRVAMLHVRRSNCKSILLRIDRCHRLPEGWRALEKYTYEYLYRTLPTSRSEAHSLSLPQNGSGPRSKPRMGLADRQGRRYSKALQVQKMDPVYLQPGHLPPLFFPRGLISSVINRSLLDRRSA